MEGQTLGNYEILGKLGEGGMGQVWRARDKRLNRMVAIKLLPESSVSDPTSRSRFEQEAKALAALNNSHIVGIYDVGEDQGKPYLVSELVDGDLLRTLLQQGPLATRKAITIATQVAEGLAATHAIGIIHRDLKPENIMLTKAGDAKILDFGLAKQQPTGQTAEKTATMALSQPGAVMGTVGYMAPEQVRAEAVDARTDVFSFGCVLYEMLSGRRAFQSTNPVETMHAILKSDPPELTSDPVVGAGVPHALEGIVHRCLEKDPNRRFQSAADLAFALKSIGTMSSSMSSTRIIDAPGIDPVKPEHAKLKQRVWGKWIGIAAGIGLVATGGYFAGKGAGYHDAPTFQRITFRKGWVDAARFGADGRTVLYSAHFEGGAGRTYLATPGNPEARDLGLPDNAILEAVSTKGDIAFRTGDTLQVTTLAGGQSRPLLDGVSAADWAPDGESMAVLRGNGPQKRIEYPVGTPLVTGDPYILPGIRVSPDGVSVAYASYREGRKVAIFIADKSGKTQTLGIVSGETTTTEYFPLAWTPDKIEIWFRSFDTQDPETIFGIDMKGRKRVVTNLPSDVVLHDVSRRGRALLSTNSWQHGIMAQAPGATTERDVSCLDKSRLIGISDDGSMIAANVVGDSGGKSGSIYIRKTDGSPAVRIGDGQGYELSPDGKDIAGYDFQQNGFRRFAIFPTGPGDTRPVKQDGFVRAAAFGFLGEAKYLLAGMKPGKKWQCFSWDSGKNAVEPICPEDTPDTLLFLPSPDRKQLLTLAPDRSLVTYTLDGTGAAQKVAGIGKAEDPLGWTADGRSLYVIEEMIGRQVKVVLVDPVTGKRTPWKELTLTHAKDLPGDMRLRITPDGRAYAYTFTIHHANLYVASGMLPATAVGPPPPANQR